MLFPRPKFQKSGSPPPPVRFLRYVHLTHGQNTTLASMYAYIINSCVMFIYFRNAWALFLNMKTMQMVFKVLKILHDQIPSASHQSKTIYHNAGVAGDQLTIERAVNSLLSSQMVSLQKIA